jgi:hypothetical protein
LQVQLRADAATGHVDVVETTPGTAPARVSAHVVQPDGSATQFDVPPSAPGEYAADFPLAGPGTYLVRVAEDGVGEAEAGLPVSYPAEFRQVSPDPTRMDQIARAGGGHVLSVPADAFAGDLPPVTTPLPLQRILLLLAALLLPLEIALRRLRISPRDVWEWLRHPHRVALDLPHWRPDFAAPITRPPWVPGAWKGKPAPPPAVWVARKPEQGLGGHATPGLARDTTTEADEEDALAAATRWLAARRGGSGDHG